MEAATKALESASALKALPADGLDGHASGIAQYEWEAVVQILRPRAEWWPQLHFRIHSPGADKCAFNFAIRFKLGQQRFSVDVVGDSINESMHVHNA